MPPPWSDSALPVRPGERSYALIGAMAASAIVMASLSPVSAVLPFLGQLFGTTVQTASWILTAYLLLLTVCVLPAGRWGDMYGDRKVFLTGSVLALVSTILTGMAPNLMWLLILRSVQGIAGAMVGATSLALVSRVFPREQLGRVVAAISFATALGSIAGANLTTWLVQVGHWRWLFWMTLPFAVVALLCAARLPEPVIRSEPGRRMDWPGAICLMAALAALSLSLTHQHDGGPQFSAGIGWHGGMLLLAGGLLLAFFWAERRAVAPLLPIHLLANGSFLAALAAHTLLHLTMMGSMSAIPFMVQLGLGLTPTHTGWVLTVVYVSTLVMSPVSGWLYDRTHSPWVMAAAMMAMGTGIVLLGTLSTRLDLTGVIILTAMMGAGVGLFMTANNAALLNSVPRDARGLVSGTIEMTRQMGHALGATITGATLATGLATAGRAAGVTLAGAVSLSWMTMAGVALAGVLLSLWPVLQREAGGLSVVGETARTSAHAD